MLGAEVEVFPVKKSNSAKAEEMLKADAKKSVYPTAAKKKPKNNMPKMPAC